MKLQVNWPGYEKIEVELGPQGELIHYHLWTSRGATALFLWALQNHGPQIQHWPLETLAQGLDLPPRQESKIQDGKVHERKVHERKAQEGKAHERKAQEVKSQDGKEPSGDRGALLGAEPSSEGARALRLLRELILKARGQWKLPYEGEIVCNCRNVSSERIDQAVAAAVPSVAGVAAWTTACTSCTTCRPKIEEIIEHRRSGSKQTAS